MAQFPSFLLLHSPFLPIHTQSSHLTGISRKQELKERMCKLWDNRIEVNKRMSYWYNIKQELKVVHRQRYLQQFGVEVNIGVDTKEKLGLNKEGPFLSPMVTQCLSTPIPPPQPDCQPATNSNTLYPLWNCRQEEEEEIGWIQCGNRKRERWKGETKLWCTVLCDL